jgi:hypothetical protein
VIWSLRTLTPPLREIAHFAASRHPLRYRTTASLVRLRLWGVELGEMLRLLAGAAPRR